MKSPLILLLAISTGTASLGITCARNEHLRAAFLKRISHSDGKRHSAATVRKWQRWNADYLKRFEFACSTEVGAESASELSSLNGGSLEAGGDALGVTPASRPLDLPTEDATLLAVLDTQSLPVWDTERDYAGDASGFYGSGLSGGIGYYGMDGGIGSGVGSGSTAGTTTPITVTPEPGSLALMLTGLVGMAWKRWRVG